MSSLNARKPLVGSSFGPSCRMPTGIHHLLLGNLTTGWIHRCRLFFFFLGQRTNSLPSCPLFSRPLPLEIGSQIQPGGLGERCKLPQWGLGRSRSRQTICCTLESKCATLVAAVFVDSPKNKCNILHKTSLISYGGSSSSRGRALWGVFLLAWGRRRHCPIAESHTVQDLDESDGVNVSCKSLRFRQRRSTVVSRESTFWSLITFSEKSTNSIQVCSCML